MADHILEMAGLGLFVIIFACKIMARIRLSNRNAANFFYGRWLLSGLN